MITFGQPYLLLLLLALPVIAWLKGRSGARPAFLYSSVALVKGIMGLTRTTRGALLLRIRWLSVALFIIALARPQLGQGQEKVTSSGIDIVVAFDVSTSMAAEDFQMRGQRVNRLTIGKSVLDEFIRKRPSDRIGLVAFAGRAYVAGPLTLDHDFLLQNLDRLQMGLVEDGTAIGAGITAALNRLRDLKSKSKVIIIMTDGVNNAGKVPPLTAAEAAQTLGVKIYAIGVGTHGKAPMPYTDVFGRLQYVDQDVQIDEEMMTAVAEKTGGKYYRADNTTKLRNIYEEIDQLEKTEAEVRKYQRYQELFHWFLLAGLFFLLLEIILANTVWRTLP